jgi:hypothetical protein
VDDPASLVDSVKVVANMTVNLISDGEYDVVARDLPDDAALEQLKETVASYPCRLVRPPTEIYEDLPVLLEPGVTPPTFHIAVRLWSEDEGPSRLVLKLRVVQEPEVDNFSFVPTIVGLDIED